MGLCGKINHRVGILYKAVYKIRIADVALDKVVLISALDLLDVTKFAA